MRKRCVLGLLGALSLAFAASACMPTPGSGSSPGGGAGGNDGDGGSMGNNGGAEIPVGGALMPGGAPAGGGVMSEVVSRRDALATYARIALASYRDAHETAEALSDRVDAFTENPSEPTFVEAKDAWRAAHSRYLQTDAFRFSEGPIDSGGNPLHRQLDAWPIEAAHIDVVPGDENGGLVNDTSLELTTQSLEARHQVPDREYVSVGYHAIEFLLWGHDDDPEGAGGRSVLDYVDESAARNQDRRRLYLSLAAAMVPSHLERVVGAWQLDGESVGSYAERFVALEPTEGLRRILTGLYILSGFGLAGESLGQALDSGNQNAEHSRFSDSTHLDHVESIRGMRSVYLGNYTTLDGEVVSGVSIYDVVAEVDQALATQLATDLVNSLGAAEAVPAPFDQAILLANDDGRARVQALIDALRQQERTVGAVFEALDLGSPPQIE